MIVRNAQYFLIGVAMLAAAGLALGLTPRAKIADLGPRVDLEAMVPKQFGEWQVDSSIAPVQISPDVQAKLDKIYNQTLSRTYVNARGDRVMLSIAYGSDQSDAMAVHKPEVCYPAQGFEVVREKKGVLDLGGRSVAVKRLVATQNSRIEPITYWITVGGQTVTSGLDKKLAQMRYGLTGRVPDGLLFRMSSITSDIDRAYQLHTEFAKEIYAATSLASKSKLFGNATSESGS